jgi:hypothetical protein
MLRNKPISTEWSDGLSYVIGLLASDGNLSKDGRHISLTSKDESIPLMTREILQIGNKIGRKSRSQGHEKKYFVIQFGSKHFYTFLKSIGLTSAKSRTIKSIAIPNSYFFHFLRGCFDGDGNINEYVHSESQHLQLKFRICSASIPFLEWLHLKIAELAYAEGGTISSQKSVSTLSYGKSDTILILTKIYKDAGSYYLDRKYQIAKKNLPLPSLFCYDCDTARVAKLVYAPLLGSDGATHGGSSPLPGTR